MNLVHCKKWESTNIDSEVENRKNILTKKEKKNETIVILHSRKPEAQTGLFWRQNQSRQKIGRRDWPEDQPFTTPWYLNC